MKRIASEEEGGWRIDEERCCRFVGRMLLEGYAEGKRQHDLMFVAFMSRWKGAVPGFCAQKCTLELLKVWILRLWDGGGVLIFGRGGIRSRRGARFGLSSRWRLRQRGCRFGISGTRSSRRQERGNGNNNI